MRSADVINLYNIVGEGAQVSIVTGTLASVVPGMTVAHSMSESNRAIGVMR